MRRGTLAGVGFVMIAACGGKIAGGPGDDDCLTNRCVGPDPTNTPEPDYPAPPTTNEPYPMPPPSPTGTAGPSPTPTPTSTSPTPPAPYDPPPGLPPSHDVPCSAGSVVELSFPISAANMSSGASDASGKGWCYGTVRFSNDLSVRWNTSYPDYSNGEHVMVFAQSNGTSVCTGGKPPDVYHCGTLRYGDGRLHPQYCTVFALCENGLAHSTSFTW